MGKSEDAVTANDVLINNVNEKKDQSLIMHFDSKFYVRSILSTQIYYKI